MGRQVFGYEVQRALAVIDWFSGLPEFAQTGPAGLPIGMAGYGEGGLVAFHAAALDSRITATLVSGYFQSRDRIWEEPLDRNVWGRLPIRGRQGFGPDFEAPHRFFRVCEGASTSAG